MLSRKFKCSLEHARAANAVFSKIGRVIGTVYYSDEVTLQLIKSTCLSVLL